jgi:error-prone DNA polymerase
MKRHYPGVFVSSLLNAQPKGFYSPSTLVEDAKRHGVEVRPVDVERSVWDCTLEPPSAGAPDLALRMGLRYVKGLAEKQWERIRDARGERAFRSVEDFVERSGLDEGMLSRLAEAGALAGLEKGRRSAIWRVRGAARSPRGSLPVAIDETFPGFRELDAFQAIECDYKTTRHSPRGHPLAPLRERLAAHRFPDARSVGAMRDGRRVRYVGLVICRQRPGTASGVVFMTLEDESGFVNVVIWSRVYEKYAILIKTTNFLGVTGRLQVQDGVTHLVADSFWHPPLDLRPTDGGSRDFK